MKQLFIISLFFMLAFTGCVIENNESPDKQEANGPFVMFALKNGEQNAKMPYASGEESLNENLVERLDVFFFDDAGECLFYPATSQMTRTGSTVKINIPGEIADILFEENFKLYVVANCILSRDVMEGKSYSQLIEVVHGVTQEFNKKDFSSQPNFLMDGLLAINELAEDDNNLGEVTLNRAAAKIKVQIIGATIDGYTPVEAWVRMDNYLEFTTLGQEAPLYKPQNSDYKHSEYRPIWIPGKENEFDASPFYSYANDWESGSSLESYITIRVKWYKNDGGAEAKDYYYRIPFNYIISTPDGTDKNSSLKRNHIYTFKVNIGSLGGMDPDNMLELTPDFVIKDWTTDRIVAKLNQYDYLVVAETDIEMHDIDKRSVAYISSQPVSIDIHTVFHYTYLTSGEIRHDEIKPGDSRYPVIVANEATNKIEITSPVPINYVPTMMSFRVKNTKGLYQDVQVIQYPRQYITSEFSDKSKIDFNWYKQQGFTSFWSNNGDGNDNPPMKNFNLYTITTTSVDSSDDFIIGANVMHNEFNLTADDTLYVTKSDAATNRIVSPKFVIASQRGITSTKTPYTSAQVRCANYMEGSYPRGTWRIPTEAEMMLISRLQIDGNSAIKELFKPIVGSEGADRWWTARVDKIGSDTYYYSVKIETAELFPQKYVPGSTHASVRCVHDVWNE